MALSDDLRDVKEALLRKTGMGGELMHRDLVMYSPSIDDLRRAVRRATMLNDNLGYRFAKFRVLKTGETGVIAWPASGFYHMDFKDSVVKASGTRVLTDVAVFDYDEPAHLRYPRFSDAKLKEIMDWVAAPVVLKEKKAETVIGEPTLPKAKGSAPSGEEPSIT